MVKKITNKDLGDNYPVWHPYTQMMVDNMPIKIIKAEGVYLYDNVGKKYIDAVSSWWVNIHGHNNALINSKIIEQLETLDHIIFAGFTHSKAIEAAKGLLELLPSNQKKIFFSDNGSTAIEVAIKMAWQYYSNQGIKKTNIIAFKNSYHGDTFGAMSVSSRSVFTDHFSNLLFDVIFIDTPTIKNIAKLTKQIEDILSDNNTAAFIFEPLVQGAGGMNMYDETLLDKIIGLFQKNKVMTIADEVMTGFYRTGMFLATDYMTNKPDIICLSKGITGGVAPLGVTACSIDIYNAFLSTDRTKTLFHGHSYTAYPVACAAVVANLEMLKAKNFLSSISSISNLHKEFAKRLKKHNNAINIRQKGTIIAFDIKTKEGTSYLNDMRKTIYNFFMEEGILLRPLGNTIYIMPPYCITATELNLIYNSIEKFLDSI